MKHEVEFPHYLDEIPIEDQTAVVSCAFCNGKVRVNVFNHRKRDRCKCGARHFIRYVYRGGHPVNEEEGWRKDGREWIYC